MRPYGSKVHTIRKYTYSSEQSLAITTRRGWTQWDGGIPWGSFTRRSRVRPARRAVRPVKYGGSCTVSPTMTTLLLNLVRHPSRQTHWSSGIQGWNNTMSWKSRTVLIFHSRSVEYMGWMLTVKLCGEELSKELEDISRTSGMVLV